MKIGMQANHSLLAGNMATNAPISQGKYTRDLGTCIFLASIARPPQLLKWFAHPIRYTLVYLASI